MQTILEQVKIFLDAVGNGQAQFTDESIEEFGDACKALLRKVNEGPRTTPTIRASNIGRPTCQLVLEKQGAPRETDDYAHTMKMIIGGMIEAAAIATMKSAGLPVTDQEKEVVLEINGEKIVGHCDLTLHGRVYDVKSASPYAFSAKFNAPDGFKKIAEDDAFGYIGQGYFYSEGLGLPFGGWIAINKSTGEWAVLEPPLRDDQYREKALVEARETVATLTSEAPFSRCFTAVPETFRGKSTGRRYLDMQCSYCPFKHHCWEDEGGLTYAAQPESKAQNPKHYWYVGGV